MPYINGKCVNKPTKPNLKFDNSVNPEDFPLPATRVNRTNTLADYWKTSWDKNTFTVNQALNNLREGVFLYEVYAFYNLYYGNNSFIRNITNTVTELKLVSNMLTNKTYPGPSMNYVPSQVKSSNYILSESLYSAGLFATALRKGAYAMYMSTQ